MGKVLLMKPNVNRTVTKSHRKQSLLNQAFQDLKRDTGIDFSKVISGDEKENKRLKFKHHQERLLEG